MPTQWIFCYNWFPNCMITDGIALLLKFRFEARCITDNGHIVTINICWIRYGYPHHPQFVSDDSFCINDLLQFEKLSSKDYVSMVNCLFGCKSSSHKPWTWTWTYWSSCPMHNHYLQIVADQPLCLQVQVYFMEMAPWQHHKTQSHCTPWIDEVNFRICWIINQPRIVFLSQICSLQMPHPGPCQES